MFVIKLLCVLACVGVIGWAIYMFENHAVGQFGHRFFSTRSIAYSSIAFALILIGRFLIENARLTGDDELNGLALLVLGILAAVGRTVWNMQHTNVGIGGVGSLIHAALFTLLSQLGPIAMFVSIAAWAFTISFHVMKANKARSADE